MDICMRATRLVEELGMVFIFYFIDFREMVRRTVASCRDRTILVQQLLLERFLSIKIRVAGCGGDCWCERPRKSREGRGYFFCPVGISVTFKLQRRPD